MTGIIILAAGSSSRLGRPKQNLLYKGQTLLQRSINAALATRCEPVIVILGANADVIKTTISDYPIAIIKNEEWEEGMASSIRLGIEKIKEIKPTVDAAMLMVCDQPFVDTNLLNHLVETRVKCVAAIAACLYEDSPGVPAIFSNVYFDELLLLTGQEGAKKLLKKYKEDIAIVPFPLGSTDIDAESDYEKLS